MDANKLAEDFHKDGFVVIKKYISKDSIDQTQSYAADFLLCQKSPESIIQAMSDLESSSKENFYEFCKRMGQVPSVINIALQKNILSIVQSVLNHTNIHLVDSALFYNKLSVKRLQYDWHQENSYFPNAKEVITLWYPWLHEVNEKNGTMIMAKGGHKSKHLAERIPVYKGLTQMKISEKILTDFEKIYCDFELGDGILFSMNSPHRTGHNSTDTPRSTIVTRFTDKIGKFDGGWDAVSY